MIGPPFELKTSENGSHPVVTVRGEIDIKTAPELEQALVDFIDREVIVDLSEVEFIDSTGLRVLASARARMEGDGGHLVVCAPDDGPVVRTMRLAGLAGDFQVIRNPDELTGP